MCTIYSKRSIHNHYTIANYTDMRIRTRIGATNVLHIVGDVEEGMYLQGNSKIKSIGP